MSDCTGDFSIEVNETKYIIEVESCINSTGINNITLSPTSGANIEINTCMIPATHPVITPAPDQDNSGNVFVQDVFLDGNGHVTGLLSAGVNFSGYTQSGDNVSIFVNDAGYITGYTETGLNTFITGTSFNCTTKELLESLNDGTIVTGDLSCIVVSGDNISLLTNDSGYATTGQLASTSGHLQGQIDAIPADTNTFVSGVQYDTAQRDIILTRTDSVTLTGNLDVVVHSGDNVSKLTNDAGYITGYTETDPIFSASPASSISSGDITNWNDAYGWGNHSTSGYLVSGDNVSLLNNDVPYAVSGSHIEVNAASDSDNSGQVFIQDLLVDEYGHVTGLATATASGQVYTAGTGLALAGNQFNIDETVIQSGDNVSLLVNDAGYLTSGTNHSVTGASFDCSSKELYLTQTDGSITTGDLGCVVVSGDNISLLANDVGYITGYVETGVNTFVTGLSFNSGTNNLVLQRNDSATITGQLDGVLVSGTSYHISVNGTGVDGSGRTYVQDILVDSYGHITGITTATETEVDTNTEYTAGTGLSLDGTQFNISGVETSLLQGTVDNNQLTSSSVTINAGTGLVGGGEISLGNSGTLNIDSSVVQTGDNISVLNNDAGYITGFTETLTSLTGDSVNTKLIYTDENGVANDVDLSWAMDDTNLSRLVSGSIDTSGIATFTRDDGTSFNVDFSSLFDDTNLSRITSGNFDTSSGILTLTRELDDTSVSVNLDGRYSTTDIYVTGIDFDHNTGFLVLSRTGAVDISGSLDNRYPAGNGTTNYVAKWTSSKFISTGIIYDDGTAVGIGTNSPDVNLDIGSNDSTPKALSVRHSTVPSYVSNSFDGTHSRSTFSTNSYNISSGAGIEWSSGVNANYSTAAIDLTTRSFAYGSQIRFYTATGIGVDPDERMIVDKNGNVGIGTSSPAQNLHIVDSAENGQILLENASGVQIKLQTFSTGGAGRLGVVGTTSDDPIYLRTNNDNRISIGGSASQNQITINPENDNADFQVRGQNDNNVIRVDAANDRLGVGIYNPTRKLDVDGNAQIGGITMGSGVFSTGFPGITNTNTYGNLNAYAMVAGPTQTVVNGEQGVFVRLSGDATKQYSINHTAATQTINSNQTSYRAGSTVFNELSGNIDFKIHTNNTHNTFYVDGATHQVGIGTNSIDSGDVLNVNGDSMFSGTRPVHINTNGGGEWMSKKGDSGGWAFDIRGLGNSGTVYTGLGWYGSNDTLLWQFWGGSYLYPWIKQTTSETTFNETAENRDFRVEGQAETHLIFADASNSNVGIGQSAPKSRLTVTADANDEYGIRLGNAAGGGGSVTGISKLGLDHWAPTLNHPAISLTTQEVSTASYSADLLIQTRTQNADVAPITRYHFLAGGRLGVGGYPTSKGAGASGLVDVYGPVLARGGVASNQTSAGALDWSGQTLRIRSWGSGVGQGNMQFRVAGGGGSADTAVLALDSGLVMTHYGSAATIAGGSSYELAISASAATLAGNRFQILSTETVVNNAGSSLDFRVEGNGDNRLLHVDAGLNSVGIGTGVPSTVSSANRGKLHVVNDESSLADFLVGDPNSQQPYFGIKMASTFISAIFGPSNSSKLGGFGGSPDTCRIRYYGGPSDSGTYWTQESNFQDYELIPYLADVSQGSKFKVDVSGAVTFNNAFTFPTGDGTNGQTLVTDGAGSISWGAGASSSSDAVRGTVSVTTTTGIFAVGGGYTTGALDVYLNGIKLADTIDYTATNGTSISLTSPATSGDILSYVGYDRLTVAGTLQDTGDTVNGNFTVNGDLVVMGYKETHTDNGSTGASQTIAITGSTIQTFTLTNNCVFTLPSADAGRSFTILLKTGAGSFTASFTGTDPVKFPSDSAPSITTSGSRMDVFTFISDGTNWYGDSQQDYHV